MAGVQLRDYQYDALMKMRNGCILNGGVGVGKSRTSLAYYYILNGGEVNTSQYVKMRSKPKDLYIITTALKRDKFEWELELINFNLSAEPEHNMYHNKIIIDSWNNIKNYVDVKDAFFIFDEQRVIGYGTWAKSFLKITSKNEWILLTATPGDTWSDYMTVFIANGWYKNKTDFERKHAVWSRYSKFPKIERWVNEGRLIRLRNHILIEMEMIRTTTQHHEHVTVDYNRILYANTATKRWNPYLDRPIENASEFCYVLRKIVNSDPSRLYAVMDILNKKPKAIIFYNFDYELELLRMLFGDTHIITEKNAKKNDNITKEDVPWLHLVDERIAKAEWNGHRHEEIPSGDYWAYLVQYAAGSEGWNCITTDTIIFYSQNYSYRVLLQSSGRIDRMTTLYKDLYYYHLRSNSKIDLAIRDAQKRKKNFNERSFVPSSLNLPNRKILKPFVKWAGGKTQIVDTIKNLMPREYNTYFEPFVGGGALLLDISPKKAYINDSNEDLICVYRCLQDDYLFDNLIKKMDEHEDNHNEDYYYDIRSLDRLETFKDLPIYERAARMIYLNKACFNGLYRVNSKGYFNVPSSRKDKIKVYDIENITLLKEYFTNNNIDISCQDFEDAVKHAKKDDFIYFDPPYDILDDKESFSCYLKDCFVKDSQIRLFNLYKELSDRGVKLMLSNHKTKHILELYKNYNIYIVTAKRTINSDSDGRGDVEEVIITNY